MSKTRTAGDGMECEANATEIAKKNIRKNSEPSRKGPMRLIQIHPASVVKVEKSKPKLQTKCPKFVPYEPYPGAVKPIVPQVPSGNTKKSRNNMDINTLISQMSQMDTNISEFKPQPSRQISLNDKTEGSKEALCIETVKLQKQVENLMLENGSLKDQLKQQVQVNKELKTMLVASMGEDLETQVQSLNEDKKFLANALLNSAQHLSTHQLSKARVLLNGTKYGKQPDYEDEDACFILLVQKGHTFVDKKLDTNNEQTEWLAGQCEVWRSKFLASSLMVEELANWKKLLSEKTETLTQAISKLLDERCRARDMMLCTYKNLYSLHEKWLENIAIADYTNKIYNSPIGNLNLNASLPHSTNILDLASVNLKLSENVSSSAEKQDISNLYALPSATDAEKFAEAVMAAPLDVKSVNEAPVHALVHHAYSNSGNTVRPVASCSHCHGKVQLL